MLLRASIMSPPGTAFAETEHQNQIVPRSTRPGQLPGLAALTPSPSPTLRSLKGADQNSEQPLTSWVFRSFYGLGQFTLAQISPQRPRQFVLDFWV